MGILQRPNFMAPPMIEAPNYNPIAVAQAAAQAQAQEAMRRGGLGDGSVPAGTQSLGGAQGGGSVSTAPGVSPATAAGAEGSGGLMGSIGKLFGNGGGGDISSIMKMLAMLG